MKRDSNLELYRCIVMLFIVAHHFVVNSGIMDAMWEHPSSRNSIFLFLFGAWGKTGINCFVLITGYFMCNTKFEDFKIQKFLKIFFQTLFYNILIFLFFLSINKESFSINRIIEVLTPINSIEHNFVSCFLLFYLCIPFLNTLISNIDEKEHIILICLCFSIYTLCGMLFGITMNYISWFIVLYFIASYLRLYPKPIMNNCKLWGFSTCISIMLSIISIIGCIYVSVKTNHRVPYYFVSDSNAIFAVLTSICSFLFFKNLRIKQSKLINTFASTTFGILLIHANCDTMRHWLWQDLLNVPNHINSPNLIIFAIVSVVCIFIICSFIDYIRGLLFKPIYKYFEERIQL